MKKILFTLAIGSLSGLQAQTDSLQLKEQIFVKANAVFLPVGIINTGVEYQLSNKMTIQADLLISPWKSFVGRYAQVYMVGVDTRYYFGQAFKNWYVGFNLSGARFIMQKFNYWFDGTAQYVENGPIYQNTDLYQDGYGLFFGATAGYQYKINDRFNLDFYLSAGSVQSFYKGLHKVTGERYDEKPNRDFDRSGEWLPYRGGVMISYRL